MSTRRLLPLVAAAAVALAAAIASLLPLPARADAQMARAEEIVSGKCFICHGMEGESSSPLFPRLTGQNAAYVARQLADYQSGKRVSSTMQPMVAGLDADDFAALGRYFASRPTSKHEVADPGLAQVGAFVYERGNPYSGVAACSGCHGSNGHGTDLLPRLAGQHAEYVEKRLKEVNSRAGTNDNAIMHAVASRLTELEIKAVSAFISGME